MSTPSIAEAFEDQDTIRNKLILYMLQKHGDPQFIEKFKKGYCSGISSLWLYTKWLQTQPKDPTNPNEPRDDYDWFKHTIETIVNWDGLTAIDPKSNLGLDFERFISYIEYFQNINEYRPISQGSLHESLLDTKGRQLHKEYSITSLLTLEQLMQLLREDIIREGKLILISSHNHATAIFKKDGVYFYFDPNQEFGEI